LDTALDDTTSARDGLRVTPLSIPDPGLRMGHKAGEQPVTQRAQTPAQPSAGKASSGVVTRGWVGLGFPPPPLETGRAGSIAEDRESA
jgi:hypothetical protein